MSAFLRRPTVLLLGPLVLLMVLQLVPFGRDHSAPPDRQKVAWDSPRTLELAKRACFDCHSNQTRWPWYSHVAPVSWRIQDHVQEGRAEINFDAFNPADKDVAEAAGETAEVVQKHEMPPFDYKLAHPEARLSDAERKELAAGLERTFAAFVEKEGKRSEGAATTRSGRGVSGLSVTPPAGVAAAEAGESQEEEAREHGRHR